MAMKERTIRRVFMNMLLRVVTLITVFIQIQNTENRFSYQAFAGETG